MDTNEEKGTENGSVRVFYPNGDIYEGQVGSGVRSGWGRYLYTSMLMNRTKSGNLPGPNKDLDVATTAGSDDNTTRDQDAKRPFVPIYEGQWKDGRKEGFGTFRESETSCVAGRWSRDRLHGFCVSFDHEGNRFDGFFRHGKRHGFGRMTTREGVSVGSYVDNRPHGFHLCVSHASTEVHSERYTGGTLEARVSLDQMLPMVPLVANAIEEMKHSLGAGAPDKISVSVGSQIRRLSVQLSRKSSDPKPFQRRASAACTTSPKRIAGACAPLSHRGVASWSVAHVKLFCGLCGIAEEMERVISRHRIDGEALLALLRICIAESDDLSFSSGPEAFSRELDMTDVKLGWFFLTASKEVVRLEYRRKERIQSVIPLTSNPLDSQQDRQAIMCELLSGIPELQQYLIPYADLVPNGNIGEGGFGTVRLFYSNSLQTQVAAKEFRRDFSASPDYNYYKVRALREFANELALLVVLRHPNVTLLWGVVLDAPKPLILTEYVSGGSLLDLLHRRRIKLSKIDILSIAKDVCAGMEFLHHQKVLHCDLKSSNILLKARKDGPGEVSYIAKLCDFGLAKSFELCPLLGGSCGIVDELLSMQDSAYELRCDVGTPHWMAPETLRGERHTYKSDVYAFGLVLWELMTNRIPFADLSSKTITAAVGYGMLKVKLPRASGRVQEALCDMILQCTHQEAAKRPSFDALHQTLRDLMKCEGLECSTNYTRHATTELDRHSADYSGPHHT
eukprot:Gregarina_sp_Pseudo_9__5361@NODE_644_length_2429_cov_8_815900_g607_i0_p1_GENE_NODE_644_length_2429_cov_8_815900_g607_i0NODE_644_length_2429_cov_8_815900_g607_i0_p1_ORF_typecomplete_len768_score99_96Pkinase_Tyr/PF07714_17/1_1e61Pkinase/PF00069_25/3_8e02Pkinase/PF00069_25/5_9e56Pkinase_fungal/PF17667_1/3_4e11MORN/PF02493_20/3_4e03MORN/PF02493_20/78MORN/PF02493_20/0_00085MORN/PF02493_20/1_3e02MORN/PF02493_20/0_0047MORN/PF02493_20/20Kdo/PF06293_14/3e05Kinaselike/PF14531_6/9_2Kinaselike/PF14531_6/0_0